VSNVTRKDSMPHTTGLFVGSKSMMPPVRSLVRLTYFSCDLRFRITLSNMLQGTDYSNAVSKYLDLEAGVQDESEESDNSDDEREKLNRMFPLLATARTLCMTDFPPF
jgi:hypothetical protein